MLNTALATAYGLSSHQEIFQVATQFMIHVSLSG